MTAAAKKRGAHRDAATSMQIQVGIITISDRASAGDYDDLGGPALKQVAQKIGWHVLAEAIVPDEIDTDSGDNSIVCEARLRLDSDDGGHGYRPA